MSDNEDFIESSFFEEKLDIFGVISGRGPSEPPGEAYPEDHLYKAINIRITLEDDKDLKYSVACPEWMYCMPTANPHEIAGQIIKGIMDHNSDVMKGGYKEVKAPN